MSESKTLQQLESSLEIMNALSIPTSVVGKTRYLQYLDRVMGQFQNYEKYAELPWYDGVGWLEFFACTKGEEGIKNYMHLYKLGASMATKPFTQALDYCQKSTWSLESTYTVLQGWIDFEGQGKEVAAKRRAESAAERNRQRVAAHREKQRQIQMDLGIRETPEQARLKSLGKKHNDLTALIEKAESRLRECQDELMQLSHQRDRVLEELGAINRAESDSDRHSIAHHQV